MSQSRTFERIREEEEGSTCSNFRGKNFTPTPIAEFSDKGNVDFFGDTPYAVLRTSAYTGAAGGMRT